jgi:hypothetical protein
MAPSKQETVDSTFTDQPWSAAGALVVRRHLDRDYDSPKLSDPEPCTVDPVNLDEGFASFVMRYAQRVGHLPFGTVMQMADAWGIEAEGELALCDAAEPNLVLWPRSSAAFLSHLAYLLQYDPERLRAHETSPAKAEDGCLVPSMKAVDPKLYATRQPQTEPRWLPAVFCAKREGVGKRITYLDALNDTLTDALTEILSALPPDAADVNVKVAKIDRHGKVIESFDLGDIRKSAPNQA